MESASSPSVWGGESSESHRPASAARHHPAGKGQVFKRHDGKYAFRVVASNGRTVATDGSQGYNDKADARSTLEKLLKGEYFGPIEEL